MHTLRNALAAPLLLPCILMAAPALEWRTDHTSHFRPDPAHPGNIPLTPADMDLIPSVWRSPDRVYNAGGGRICLELDSLEGDRYRMIVKLTGGAPTMETYYRTVNEYREKQ